MRWATGFKLFLGSLVLEGYGFEESGAEIVAIDDGTYDLYEIPQYGGESQYEGNYPSIVEAKKVAESWT